MLKYNDLIQDSGSKHIESVLRGLYPQLLSEDETIDGMFTINGRIMNVDVSIEMLKTESAMHYLSSNITASVSLKTSNAEYINGLSENEEYKRFTVSIDNELFDFLIVKLGSDVGLNPEYVPLSMAMVYKVFPDKDIYYITQICKRKYTIGDKRVATATTRLNDGYIELTGFLMEDPYDISKIDMSGYSDTIVTMFHKLVQFKLSTPNINDKADVIIVVEKDDIKSELLSVIASRMFVDRANRHTIKYNTSLTLRDSKNSLIIDTTANPIEGLEENNNTVLQIYGHRDLHILDRDILTVKAFREGNGYKHIKKVYDTLLDIIYSDDYSDRLALSKLVTNEYELIQMFHTSVETNNGVGVKPIFSGGYLDVRRQTVDKTIKDVKEMLVHSETNKIERTISSVYDSYSYIDSLRINKDKDLAVTDTDSLLFIKRPKLSDLELRILQEEIRIRNKPALISYDRAEDNDIGVYVYGYRLPKGLRSSEVLKEIYLKNVEDCQISTYREKNKELVLGFILELDKILAQIANDAV